MWQSQLQSTLPRVGQCRQHMPSEERARVTGRRFSCIVSGCGGHEHEASGFYANCTSGSSLLLPGQWKGLGALCVKPIPELISRFRLQKRGMRVAPPAGPGQRCVLTSKGSPRYCTWQ